MPKIVVTEQIESSPPAVFDAVANLENLPTAIPMIQRIEFLGDQKSGVGTRFRETRLMGKSEHITELEVTELVENEHVRMVSDTHGTVWDSVFTVKPDGESTTLEIAMDARGHRMFARAMNFLLQGLFKKGLQSHIAAVKEHCER